MPELVATSALGGLSVTHGELTLTERPEIEIASLAFHDSEVTQVKKALKSELKLEFPDPRVSTKRANLRAIHAGADQLFLLWENGDGTLSRALSQIAYSTDQSDNWSALELSGPSVRRALERICPIDLDPDTFPLDASARTVMEHIGAFIIRTGEDAFLLMAARSFAGSFAHAIETSMKNISGD